MGKKNKDKHYLYSGILIADGIALIIMSCDIMSISSFYVAGIFIGGVFIGIGLLPFPMRSGV